MNLDPQLTPEEQQTLMTALLALPSPHTRRDPHGTDRMATALQQRLRTLGWKPWWESSARPPEQADPAEHVTPWNFLQWKGTEVCIDLTCTCGESLHFDGYFLYAWRCPSCSQVWKMGDRVPMEPVDTFDGIVQDDWREDADGWTGPP